MADIEYQIKINEITQTTKNPSDNDLFVMDQNFSEGGVTKYHTASTSGSQVKNFIFSDNDNREVSFKKISGSIDATASEKTAKVPTLESPIDDSSNAASTAWVNKFWNNAKDTQQQINGAWVTGNTFTITNDNAVDSLLVHKHKSFERGSTLSSQMHVGKVFYNDKNGHSILKDYNFVDTDGTVTHSKRIYKNVPYTTEEAESENGTTAFKIRCKLDGTTITDIMTNNFIINGNGQASQSFVFKENADIRGDIITNKTANRVAVIDSDTKLKSSDITTDELNCLDNINVNIKTALEGKATDDSVVHKTGAEEITGVKTFKDVDIGMKMSDFDVTSATTNQYKNIVLSDKNSKNVGKVAFGGNKDWRGTYLISSGNNNIDNGYIAVASDGTNGYVDVVAVDSRIKSDVTIGTASSEKEVDIYGNTSITSSNNLITGTLKTIDSDVKPSSNTAYKVLRVEDKNSKYLGGVEVSDYSSGMHKTSITANHSGKGSSISIFIDKNGNTYTSAPSPEEHDSSTKIATTEWVTQHHKLKRRMYKCIETQHIGNFPLTIFNDYNAETDLNTSHRKYSKEFDVPKDSYLSTCFSGDCNGIDGAELQIKLTGCDYWVPIAGQPYVEWGNSVNSRLYFNGDIPAGSKLRFCSPFNDNGIKESTYQFNVNAFYMTFYLFENEISVPKKYSPWVYDYDSTSGSRLYKTLAYYSKRNTINHYNFGMRAPIDGLCDIHFFAICGTERMEHVLINNNIADNYYIDDEDYSHHCFKTNIQAGDLISFSKANRLYNTADWTEKDYTITQPTLIVNKIESNNLVEIENNPTITPYKTYWVSSIKPISWSYEFDKTGYFKMFITAHGIGDIAVETFINGKLIGYTIIADHGQRENSFYIYVSKGDKLTLATTYYKCDVTAKVTNNTGYSISNFGLELLEITNYDNTFTKTLHYNSSNHISYIKKAEMSNVNSTKVNAFSYTFPEDGIYDVYMWLHSMVYAIPMTINGQYIGYAYSDNSDLHITKFRVKVQAREVLKFDGTKSFHSDNRNELFVDESNDTFNKCNYFILKVN